MNCPSHTDETIEHEGRNQNPPALAADLTTRSDLNGIANLRLRRDHLLVDEAQLSGELEEELGQTADNSSGNKSVTPVPTPDEPISSATTMVESAVLADKEKECVRFIATPSLGNGRQPRSKKAMGSIRELCRVLVKFSKFIGPGFMVSVAYIDPGNYSTDVAAGASTRFSLLFIVLMSNMFAVILQSLAVRLGSVTGLNLAENCRAHLPKWLNLILYIFAEAAIIATDIAEVGEI
jgi:metal iron transporter